VKRTELNVGDEPYTRASFGRRQPTTTGSGVLVDVLSPDGTEARYQDIVQLGHLRGAYAETLAAVKAAAEAARKRMEADWEHADLEKEKTERTVKRARNAGAASTMRHGESVVTMRAVHLDALLDRLSQAETMLDNLHSVNNPELA
jgi:23S rRNA maturation mini-RNase III